MRFRSGVLALHLWFAVGAGVAQEPRDQGDVELARLVTSYFKIDDATERGRLATTIEQAAGGSVERVAAAVADAQVWDSVDGDRLVMIDLSIPSGYDSRERHPLLLVLSGSANSDADRIFDEWIESQSSVFIVASVNDFNWLGFKSRAADAVRLTELLAALKRRYHLDSDRIFLCGSGAGGDAAFALAAMHADAFAGVIIREATLEVPYRRQLYRLLLPNLGNAPVQLAWTEPDLSPHEILQGRRVEVALSNHLIAAIAQELDLPLGATPMRSAGDLPLRAWDDLLTGGRRHPIRRVSHWFRYPVQGRAGFLRQRGFAAPVWEGDQIDIVPAPHVDRDRFVTGVLESKLGNLRGEIEGQLIRVTVRRCTAVDILLQPGMLNFDRPVTVIYNGKRRFVGRVKPSVATILRSAYEDWEFQHPAWVRLRVSDKGRVLRR